MGPAAFKAVEGSLTRLLVGSIPIHSRALDVAREKLIAPASQGTKPRRVGVKVECFATEGLVTGLRTVQRSSQTRKVAKVGVVIPIEVAAQAARRPGRRVPGEPVLHPSEVP